MYEIRNPYWWAEGFKRFWATVMGLITFVIVEASESLLTILLSAFVLIAPLPNAISVYALSGKQLGFEWYTAAAFSAGVEFGPFVMIAISLRLFDGLLRQGKRWLIPFVMSVVGTVIVTVVIMLLVYRLEENQKNGQEIMALLPLISICAFIALGALAWHKAQPEVLQADQEEEERKRLQKMEIRKSDLEQELLEAKHLQQLEILSARHERDLSRISGTKPQNALPLPQTAKPQTAKLPQNLPQNTPDNLEFAVGGSDDQTAKPQSDLLRWVAENQPVTTKQVAEKFSVSKPTAIKMLRQLVGENLLEEFQDGQKFLYSVTVPEKG